MNNKVLYVGFNTDRSCLTVGMEMGFFVYDMFPFKRKCSHYFGKGIKIVEILDRTNIVALVGGGSSPAWPVNTVIVWDCKRREEVSRIEWSTEIKSLKFLRNYLLVGVWGKIFIYDPQTLTLIKSINDVIPHHICVSIPQSKEGDVPSTTLVTEGKDGHIKVINIKTVGETDFKTKDYSAHKTNVVCTGVSPDGRYCATASEKGTLIRIFSCETGDMNELRRGSSQAGITSISISKNNAYLATTSDHGTVHVFATGIPSRESEQPAVKNTTSWFRFTGLGVTQSEWSSCSFNASPNSSLCFIEDGSGITRLIVVKESGEYSSYLICVNGTKVEATEEKTPVNLLVFDK